MCNATRMLMLMIMLMLMLLPMCVESMVSSSSISNHGRIKPPLRGGGFGRGMKRPREKQTEHESVGNSARGWEPDDGRAPRSKAPRRSWWNLWGDRGAMPSILGDAVQSAFESAKRLFSWSHSPSSPGRKQSHVDKDGRLVFEGDNDKPAAIKRQIAFYFSDSNLPTDTFMKDEINKDPDGFVNLQIIASFRRMKTLNASVEDIAAAARGVDMLEVSEDGQKVRRLVPIPPEDEVLDRTIYAKPFKFNSVGKIMDQIPAWFSPYGQVMSVRMVRDFRNMREFTGAAFIEFGTEEEAQRCTTMPIKVGGVNLETCMKRDWKRVEKQIRREKQDKFQTGESKKASSPSESMAVNFHSGVFVKVDGMGYNITRQEVSSVMERHGKVKFVEMIKTGRESKTCGAIVRFDRASQAKSACSDSDMPLLGGEVPKLSLIEGSEEERENEKLKQRTAQLNAKIPFWQKKFRKR